MSPKVKLNKNFSAAALKAFGISETSHTNIPHFDVWKQQKFPKCDLFTIKVTDFSKSDHKNTKMKIFFKFYTTVQVHQICVYWGCSCSNFTGVGQIKENCGLGNLGTVNQSIPICVYLFMGQWWQRLY